MRGALHERLVALRFARYALSDNLQFALDPVLDQPHVAEAFADWKEIPLDACTYPCAPGVCPSKLSFEAARQGASRAREKRENAGKKTSA